jgi:ZIP family zinc transporter
MLSAFCWGLLATSSLILGGLIATRFTLSRKVVGIIMAFGAGTLISAVSYELIFEAVQMARLTGFPALGLFAGATTFFGCEALIAKFNAGKPTAPDASVQSRLVVPMVLAIILDGMPESIVIGLGILEGGTVSIATLTAIFISNLPEAIAGTVGMKAGGASRGKILSLWCIIALMCAVASAAGFVLFGDIRSQWFAFVQAFAGSAILMMLANAMMPEAFEHGGKLTDVFTVLGFCTSVAMIVLEDSKILDKSDSVASSNKGNDG